MSILPCSAPDCDEPAFIKKRQLCKPHYSRWYYSVGAEVIASTPRKTKEPALRNIPSNCLECGRRIERKAKTGPAPKYCTVKCRRLVHERRRITDGRYAAELEARRLATATRELPVHTCLECGGNWSSTHRRSKFCSSRCLNRHTDRNNPLRCSESDCDRGVRGKGLCAMHWRRKARADGREANPAWTESRKANYHKRRAQKLTTQVEDLRPIDIYERDIWLCGLCSTPVDPESAWPDPMSPSLDHIVPLSKGGAHTYENTQLAHLTCNVSKGNRVAA